MRDAVKGVLPLVEYSSTISSELISDSRNVAFTPSLSSVDGLMKAVASGQII